VIFSGVRITAEAEKMREVDEWLRRQMENIERDPAFLIVTVAEDSTTFPWETLDISGDTARINFQRRAPDAQTPFMLYAHFHLMERMDRLERWLPEAHEEEGLDLELAILERIADAWLYGRSIYDAAPYGPLDKILYAREFGYLRALVLTAREDDFRAERERWLAENPDGLEEFRSWFEETFAQEPPGYYEPT
jgi:hypothetical protein